MLNDMRGDGLGRAPRAKEPESAMLPGMAAPKPAANRPARPVGAVWEEAGKILRQTPAGAVVVVPDPPTPVPWMLDFNPATGNARANFAGEMNVNGTIALTGTATLNGSAL